MQDGVQGKTCRWPVEENEQGYCGKPAVEETTAPHPMLLSTYPIPVCQEHLEVAHYGGATTDID